MKSSDHCINIGVGISYGTIEAVKDSINQSLERQSQNPSVNKSSVNQSVSDELPIPLTTENDEVSEIITEGNSLQYFLKSTKVSKKFIRIFGFISSKVRSFDVITIIKESCWNLWV